MAMGGDLVVYTPGETGTGLDIEVFDGAGYSKGRDLLSLNMDHIGVSDEICVAGKRLDDSYTAITDQMGNALRCGLGANPFVENCGDLFKKLVDNGKIKKGCSYKTVYDKNEERYNLAVKKECIK